MRLLLIDTCGEVGSIALAHDGRVLVSEEMPARAASSTLLPAIQRALMAVGWGINELQGVGVVSGPGSFTGVRVGLAAAKGLCEARNLPMAAVSRLSVLAGTASLAGGYAVLDAGRGEFFVRHSASADTAGESLWTREQLVSAAAGQRVVVAESRLLVSLAELAPDLHTLSAAAALPLVLRVFAEHRSDAAQADANYVRCEQQIYGKATVAPSPDLSA